MGASFRGSCTRRRSSSSLRASAASTKTTAPMESRRPPTLLAGSVVSAALRYCRGLRRRSSAGVSEDDAITSAAHTDVPISAMNANAIHPGLMRRCPTIDGARRSFKKGTAKWKSDSDVCRGLVAKAAAVFDAMIRRLTRAVVSRDPPDEGSSVRFFGGTPGQVRCCLAGGRVVRHTPKRRRRSADESSHPVFHGKF